MAIQCFRSIALACSNKEPLALLLVKWPISIMAISFCYWIRWIVFSGSYNMNRSNCSLHMYNCFFTFTEKLLHETEVYDISGSSFSWQFAVWPSELLCGVKLWSPSHGVLPERQGWKIDLLSNLQTSWPFRPSDFYCPLAHLVIYGILSKIGSQISEFRH